MQHLDQEMRVFLPTLTGELGLSVEVASKLATTIAADVRFLETHAKDQIRNATAVNLKSSLEELHAFQAWMDLASSIQTNPAITRAQVIAQNYVCFVYLGEACFRVLATHAKPGSATKRCCQFLTDNPVRAFRNAIAHANWEYRSDYSGIIFWARKGADSSESLSRFEVSQVDLDFWQALSRCAAYAAYTQL